MQFSNALGPILITVSGITIVIKLAKSLNESASILVTKDGIVNVVILTSGCDEALFIPLTLYVIPFNTKFINAVFEPIVDATTFALPVPVVTGVYVYCTLLASM